MRYKIETIAVRAENLSELMFEKIYGLEYRGTVPHNELITDHKESARHATSYMPSPVIYVSTLINEALITGLVFDNFIDIGSGKGKACIYAARTGKFSKIIGVEFSKQLVDIALLNVIKCRLEKHIIFMQVDAAEFIFPKGRNLIFIYNPFDEVILLKLLRNNVDNFKYEQSFVAYANDVHRHLIIGLGFEAVYRSRTLSLYKYIS
jgi:SAM-dependent methyltransferase